MFDYSGGFGIGDWNLTIGTNPVITTPPYYNPNPVVYPAPGGSITYTPVAQNQQTQQMLWLAVIVLGAVILLKR